MKKSIAILLILAAFLVGICTDMAARGVAQFSKKDSPVIRKAREVYEVIDDKYIGEVDEDLMADYVAAGLVYGTGDRWSYYISAEDLQTHMEQVSNQYVGIGVTVETTETGQCRVIEVSPGSPAAEAGIQPDDVFAAVDGQDCTGMTMAELRNLVRGDVGTTVNVTMLRDGGRIDFTMVRRSLETEVVSSRMLGKTGYIAIYNFDATSAEKTIAAIEDLRGQGASSLLFDVRRNPGGLKTELLTLLDYLLPEGTIFRSQDYRGKVSEDVSDAACVDLPMAVLIDQDSYSAAEFFAAALSEFGVAKTVGAQTCGKGYFQTTQRLSDGSAISLSVGKYYTPKGVSLADEGGLTPDVPVELPPEDALDLAARRLDPEKDEQLQAALDVLQEKP